MATSDSPPNDAAPSARRRGRLTLSLRALMLAVLGLGLWLGWQVNRAREQREAVAIIRAAGGEVAYDWEFGSEGRRSGRAPKAPDWLVKRLGPEYFQDVVKVELVKVDSEGMPGQSEIGPNALASALRRLPKLKKLTLMGTQATDSVMEAIGTRAELETLDIITFFNWKPVLTDEGVGHLRHLRKLKKLHLMNAGLSDASLKTIGALTQLESLSVQGSNLTDSGIAHLKSLVNLNELFVDASRGKWTDAALVNLQGMTRLESLGLQDTAVTDAGLMTLCGLTDLSRVHVTGSGVTEQGMKRFRERMPKLKILE